jgi:hypothetical protein
VDHGAAFATATEPVLDGKVPPVLHGLTSEFAHGRAFSEVVAVANPAVATGFTYTVGGSYWERLASLSFVLTSDANAANRAVLLRMKDGTGATLAAVPTAAVQVAAKVYTYTYSGVQAPATDAVGLANIQPLPRLFLQPGFSVVVTIGAVQAGDQVSAIRVYREAFDTGPMGYPIGVLDENMYVAEYEQIGN